MFQADDAAQVYNHMMIAHGGYYDDEENALSAGVVAEIERAHDEYDEVSE